MASCSDILCGKSPILTPPEFWGLWDAVRATPCRGSPPVYRSGAASVSCIFLSPVDLPMPQILLARLLVLMSSPYKREGCRIAMLNLLKTLSQSIDPSTADMKELKILMLVKYLEEHTEFTWNQKSWEDKLIQFLRNSLKMT
ncbi:unnamed protein product [Rangifer tarandus platyrhynchus]|uniref:Uncharacterized protein n=1 Tax=Rangifer tarandus platyrhynchus TaxID=3082113 RepID=A0AC59Y3I9_RANTA